jgi:hypothetical protein
LWSLFIQPGFGAVTDAVRQRIAALQVEKDAIESELALLRAWFAACRRE